MGHCSSTLRQRWEHGRCGRSAVVGQEGWDRRWSGEMERGGTQAWADSPHQWQAPFGAEA
ncbi:hypothetical protein E2C01_040965 [Portunus trituberculatus]|uniref:Uncharacterized protein n=1 Tax=Portunus trituberculatus TaxID=210409 RepID=A0A5B7FS75_PORTR|nr:hypothetical protein [Portunus trituberculatus]